MATTDYFRAPQPDAVQMHWTRSKLLLPAKYESQLPEGLRALAEVLSQAGCKTFWAGKWHLGNEKLYPEDHGLQINRGGWEDGGPLWPRELFCVL